MHSILVTSNLIAGDAPDVQRVIDDYEQSIADVDGLILSIAFHQRSKLGFLLLFQNRAAATAYLERNQLALFVKANARLLGSPLCQMYEVDELDVNEIAPREFEDLQQTLQPDPAEVRLPADLAAQPR